MKEIWIINQFANTPDMPGHTRQNDLAVFLNQNGYKPTVFSSDFNLSKRKFLKGKKNFENDNQAWLSVGKLRNGLIDLFQELGSTHLQIGRNYPYLETRVETAAKYLRNIKRITDKHNILNPGALGF